MGGDPPRVAGLSSRRLSHMTRCNFRQTSPLKQTTPESVKFNVLHDDPKVSPTIYSGHNRRAQKVSEQLAGSHEPTLESEGDRSWVRLRGSIPGASDFRYFFGKDIPESQITAAATEKEKFKEAVRETANLDGENLRYTLPSDRPMSKIAEEQSPQKVKTDANNTHVFMRYENNPDLAVGRRQIATNAGSSLDRDCSPPAAPARSPATQRRQRMLRESSSAIWSQPQFPNAKQNITAKVGQVSTDEMNAKRKELAQVTPAGIIRIPSLP